MNMHFCYIFFIFVLVSLQNYQVRALEVQNTTVDLIPCKEGWHFFKDKCFKAFGYTRGTRGSQLRFDHALTECRRKGGTLATVSSKELQDFLTTFVLLDLKFSAWIGLEDKADEGAYVWTDGSTSTYRNWKPGEPSGSAIYHEDCVEMMYTSEKVGGKIGQWNDIGCSNEREYLCQAETSLTKSRDPRFCYGKNKGWKYLNSCYYVVAEKKSWMDAENYCKENFDGHLLMVKDFTVDVYLDYILSHLNEDTWIGIKIKDNRVHKWTSGWHVAYTNFLDPEEELADGTCLKRSKSWQWTTSPCGNKYSFVCEKSSTGPPVLPPAPPGARCPEKPNNWVDLDGEYCYFFDTTNNYNWYRANFECQSIGGQLVTIHSQEESDILQNFVFKRWSVFIGVYKHPYEEGFVWAEGRSRMNWTSWDSEEPNRYDEKCGEVWVRWMKWHNTKCERESGFICSIKKILAPQNEREISTPNPSEDRILAPQNEREISTPNPSEDRRSPPAAPSIYVTCASGSSCVPIVRCLNLIKLPNWLTAGQTCGPGPYALRQVCCSGPTRRPSQRLRCGQSYVEHNTSIVAEIKESVEGQWPWMAAILAKLPYKSEFVQFCSGFLIDSKHVITAASCFDDDSSDTEYTVHMGNVYYSLGEMYQITQIDIPSTYVRGKIPDSIALLTLDKAVSPSLAICLPDTTILSMDLEDVLVTVAGWGENSIDRYPNLMLKHLTNLPLWSNQDCNSVFLEGEAGVTEVELPRGIDKNLLCAGFREEELDVCSGYSGAPLMLRANDRWFAVGIMVFRVGCGAPGRPFINLRISEYLEWIKENVIIR